jgi:hypothetical protein
MNNASLLTYTTRFARSRHQQHDKRNTQHATRHRRSPTLTPSIMKRVWGGSSITTDSRDTLAPIATGFHVPSPTLSPSLSCSRRRAFCLASVAEFTTAEFKQAHDSLLRRQAEATVIHHFIKSERMRALKAFVEQTRHARSQLDVGFKSGNAIDCACNRKEEHCALYAFSYAATLRQSESRLQLDRARTESIRQRFDNFFDHDNSMQRRQKRMRILLIQRPKSPTSLETIYEVC